MAEDANMVEETKYWNYLKNTLQLNLKRNSSGPTSIDGLYKETDGKRVFELWLKFKPGGANHMFNT